MTKERTGRQILATTRRNINARIDAPRKAKTGASLSALRMTLRDAYAPTTVQHALDLKGVTARDATADDLFDILYGLRWAESYGKRLTEYFSTPWGQDTGELAL